MKKRREQRPRRLLVLLIIRKHLLQLRAGDLCASPHEMREYVVFLTWMFVEFIIPFVQPEYQANVALAS